MPTLPLPQHVLPPTASTQFGAARTSGTRPPECGGGHCGVDLYLVEGTPVYAVAAGKVVASKDSDNVAGKFVWLSHDGGSWRSHYVHLASRRVEAGQVVAEGQQIGTLGRTGIQNDAAHLHFAVSRKSGSDYFYVDPAPLLVAWSSGGASDIIPVVAVGIAALMLLR